MGPSAGPSISSSQRSDNRGSTLQKILLQIKVGDFSRNLYQQAGKSTCVNIEYSIHRRAGGVQQDSLRIPIMHPGRCNPFWRGQPQALFTTKRNMLSSPRYISRTHHASPVSLSITKKTSFSTKMADHCADPSNSKFLRQDLKLIFKNNQEWVALKKANDPAFFEKLNSGQQPDYL